MLNPFARLSRSRSARFLQRCLALLATGMLLTGADLPEGKIFKFTGNESVYYAGDVTVDDARRVAEALREIGYFNDSKVKDVLLRRDDAEAMVSFVVGEGWNTPEILDAFKQIGEMLAAKLDSKRLRLRLVDSELKVLKEILIGESVSQAR